jgi:hypothetical protein
MNQTENKKRLPYRMIDLLSWVFEELAGRMCTGFNWLEVTSSAGLL